ncbi:MAG: hypothetical protein JNK84_19135 [Phreatobacter sp.]|uniref:YciI family protein n=1 Tax=Phreatobacter sp. TaxID=1966341 RepID=UPI001A41B043|nr:hypothetical protein [Phreatobacter sp.]MBL8571193.1 hypothetical protein [Phreatobacter sp.]
MFIATLKFADRSRASQLMEGHNSWLRRGFDDGVFLLAGSLQPGLGGVILAHNLSKADLEARVLEDPFVAEGVVTAEILDIAPARADERLAFLKG